jgi:hypothetical protein
MKARLVPLTFEGKDDDFDTQLNKLKELLADEADFLEPVPLGSVLPPADAVIFPQLLGEAYRRLDEFKAIDVPIVVATSEFGMLNMWDWEIVSYLRTEGVTVIAPYKLEQTKNVCQGLGVKRELRQTKFLVFQDNPGEGMQGEIFKRFYWWEDECIGRMIDKFGFTLIKKSFKEFGAAAKLIPDAEADAVIAEKGIPVAGISQQQLRSAVKVYIALKRELDMDRDIRAVGINCLNESFYSDTSAVDDDQVHPAQVVGHADHDDQHLPIPDGPGGAEARAYPGFPRGGRPGRSHPGRSLRLSGRGAPILRHRLDLALQSAGHRRRQRHGH